ncbi:hypothetical protein MIMGU_mgv1a015615mg [Erythranthe guttata]|uniref:Photosystem II 5 kDa protein, chloroplastic n=2 Tax=Erythranthe guttata TaxID=4155 RepID=A0A022QUV3_ERYGU|nr:hypothetical protein MIMGU_mgv1a015615mg [Erythranthe guttata]
MNTIHSNTILFNLTKHRLSLRSTPPKKSYPPKTTRNLTMASMTMTASFLCGSAASAASAAAATRHLPTTSRRGAMVVRAASKDVSEEVGATAAKEESSNTRRGMMFAVAAAAASSVAKIAMADEPKRGSAEAKKKYAPICVTMPTARICRN